MAPARGCFAFSVRPEVDWGAGGTSRPLLLLEAAPALALPQPLFLAADGLNLEVSDHRSPLLHEQIGISTLSQEGRFWGPDPRKG